MVEVDWTMNGADVVALIIAGSALAVSGWSAWYARRSAHAAARSAVAEETAATIAKAQRRDEVRPGFEARQVRFSDGGHQAHAIDLKLVTPRDVDDLTVTLLPPDEGQGYVLERIGNAGTGFSGTYGEPVAIGHVAAGGVIRISVVRNTEVSGRVTLRCTCSVDGELFNVLATTEYRRKGRAFVV